MHKIVCTYFQLILCFIVFSNSLFSYCSKHPNIQSPKKNTLTKKISVPEIELRRTPLQIDFFQSYLHCNEIEFPFSSQRFYLQKLPNKAFMKATLYDFEESTSLQTFKKKNPVATFSFSKEITTSNFIHKNFLYDLIENVKKHNDQEIIRELFHPEKSNINVNSLNTVLDSSLENTCYSHEPREDVNLAFYEKEVRASIAKSKDSNTPKYCKCDASILSDINLYKEKTAIALSKKVPQIIDPIATKSFPFMEHVTTSKPEVLHGNSKYYGFIPSLTTQNKSFISIPLSNTKHKHSNIKDCKAFSCYFESVEENKLKGSKVKNFFPQRN